MFAPMGRKKRSNVLSSEELDALYEVGRGLKTTRMSQRVFKASKRLTSLKLAAFERKTGILTITDLGRQTLFMQLCIESLRQIAKDPVLKINGEALAFLLRKGHLEQREGEAGYFITTKGEESLADIDAQKK